VRIYVGGLEELNPPARPISARQEPEKRFLEKRLRELITPGD
jgi:hypothetical protein